MSDGFKITPIQRNVCVKTLDDLTNTAVYCTGRSHKRKEQERADASDVGNVLKQTAGC